MACYTNSPQTEVVLGVANGDGTFSGVTSGTSAAIEPGQRDALTIAIIGNGTIASGVVTIEEAYQVPGTTYAGTWSVITTVTASALTGGAQQLIHLAPTALVSVRVRISTTIGGGGGITAVVVEQ